ncbi:hypothetical protein POSPLADRAFT_1067971 [Postia placenta MAD-698-R-SB12]|uniref:Cytochrome P450 monooxygenase pc-3 n=1 Tax=Postia placenta MAD-698-R-SB12 TaxID=670580 RepID=A0A1X6MKH9_9APHY|nr:hypothetical protein POSPLADRAFT_1067971 [Postia placenta MAD-698-R-SB12]OSX56951.1 hypothetical protein POSPLADRAFT_1067971 [Postia placenta MAD-698-R-SB12]
MALPPGVPFLIRVSLILAFAPVCVVIVANFIWRHTDVALPTWPVTLLTVASTPLTILVRVWYRQWKYQRAAARLGAIMPPRWVGKKLGNLDILKEMLQTMQSGYIADFAWKLFNNLGNTVQMNVLGGTAYLTCDPNIIKSVLATDFNNFEKGDLFKQEMASVLGTGVFNADGDMWKWHRAMTRPFFSRDRISHFELFDRRSEQAVAKMTERFHSGYAVDFQDLISRFTLDSATEFLFGSCVNSLHSPLPYPHNQHPTPFSHPSSKSLASNPSRAEAVASAFMRAQIVLAERVAMGAIWPLLEMRKSRTGEHMRIIDEYLDPILKDALRRKEDMANIGAGIHDDKESSDTDGETLLDHLVRLTSDPVVLHDEVLNILIAGRDTTAGTLTFVVYFLCMYPDVFNRLRAEVLEKVGPNARPTYADIKEMRYLRAVINETLRLYPVVWSIHEGTLPNPDPNGKPFYLPPKTPVTYTVFAMHRRKEYWGPDADEFDPDRFLDDRVAKYLTKNPFIFLPFNAGPRICLGQQFAYNEMSFFLIKLMQHFSAMELAPEAAPPESLPPAEWAVTGWGRKRIERFWPKSHLTLYSNGGMWVKMVEADDFDKDDRDVGI